jgi:hypothetical protein
MLLAHLLNLCVDLSVLRPALAVFENLCYSQKWMNDIKGHHIEHRTETNEIHRTYFYYFENETLRKKALLDWLHNAGEVIYCWIRLFHCGRSMPAPNS